MIREPVTPELNAAELSPELSPELNAAERDAAIARIDARLDRATQAEAFALRLPFLHRVHPFTKLAMVIPVLVALCFVHNHAIPAAIIGITLLLVLVGSRMRWRQRLLLLVLAPLLVAVLSVTLGVWIRPELVANSPELLRIGDWRFYAGALAEGGATGLRLVALVAVSFLGGSTTSGGDLIRAMVQHLHLPYRLGYAGLAAFRFVPRFRTELTTIRQAQRARGIGFGRGPIGWVRSQLATLVPLLAASLRHADRVALAMDVRGFGFAPTRTERVRLRATWLDSVVALGYLAACAAALVLLG